MGYRAVGLTLIAIGALATPLGAAAQEPDPTAIIGKEEPAPVDPVPLTLAREVLDLSFPGDSENAMFLAASDQIVAQVMSALEANDRLPDDPEVRLILDEVLGRMIDEQKANLLTHVPRLMDALAQSYAAVFSLEELVDIRDFAATSSGRRFMQLSPAIVAEPAFAQANQTLHERITRYRAPSAGRIGPPPDRMARTENQRTGCRRVGRLTKLAIGRHARRKRIGPHGEGQHHRHE